MVTLASIIAYDPEVLLLDEPTANLSSGTIKEIKQVIEDSRNRNRAVVIASHDVEFVAEVSDRVYIINNGSTRGGFDAKSVLSDESLLALADMRLPLVLQTLRLLKPKLRNYPITIKDLKEATDSATYEDQNLERLITKKPLKKPSPQPHG